MIVVQISIYRPDGKLAAMMIQTQMVLPRETATVSGEGGEARPIISGPHSEK
jgi:hypothetical protein